MLPVDMFYWAHAPFLSTFLLCIDIQDFLLSFFHLTASQALFRKKNDNEKYETRIDNKTKEPCVGYACDNISI